MEYPCLTCSKYCRGMQYNPYSQLYYCPHSTSVASFTTDNKTTMYDGIVLYGKESKDGTEAR